MGANIAGFSAGRFAVDVCARTCDLPGAYAYFLRVDLAQSQ
jgi:hypothetical protein